MLGSYLLVKGSHTFLNMDIGSEAQWFPEYSVALGRAVWPPPARIDALRRPGGLYVRAFQHGEVVVNPGDGARSFTPAGPAALVRPIAGGALDDRADVRGWGLRNVPVVGALTVPAHGGVVLLQRAT